MRGTVDPLKYYWLASLKHQLFSLVKTTSCPWSCGGFLSWRESLTDKGYSSFDGCQLCRSRDTCPSVKEIPPVALLRCLSSWVYNSLQPWEKQQVPEASGLNVQTTEGTAVVWQCGVQWGQIHLAFVLRDNYMANSLPDKPLGTVEGKERWNKQAWIQAIRKCIFWLWHRCESFEIFPTFTAIVKGINKQAPKSLWNSDYFALFIN